MTFVSYPQAPVPLSSRLGVHCASLEAPAPASNKSQKPKAAEKQWLMEALPHPGPSPKGRRYETVPSWGHRSTGGFLAQVGLSSLDLSVLGEGISCTD